MAPNPIILATLCIKGLTNVRKVLLSVFNSKLLKSCMIKEIFWPFQLLLLLVTYFFNASHLIVLLKFSCSKTTVTRCMTSSLHVVGLWSSCHWFSHTCWLNLKLSSLADSTQATVTVLQRTMLLNGGKSLLAISMCTVATSFHVCLSPF